MHNKSLKKLFRTLTAVLIINQAVFLYCIPFVYSQTSSITDTGTASVLTVEFVSLPTTVSGVFYLKARTNDIEASVDFIINNQYLTTSHASGSFDYTARWDTTSLPDGMYNVKVIASKAGQAPYKETSVYVYNSASTQYASPVDSTTSTTAPLTNAPADTSQTGSTDTALDSSSTDSIVALTINEISDFGGKPITALPTRFTITTNMAPDDVKFEITGPKNANLRGLYADSMTIIYFDIDSTFPDGAYNVSIIAKRDAQYVSRTASFSVARQPASNTTTTLAETTTAASSSPITEALSDTVASTSHLTVEPSVIATTSADALNTDKTLSTKTPAITETKVEPVASTTLIKTVADKPITETRLATTSQTAALPATKTTASTEDRNIETTAPLPTIPERKKMDNLLNDYALYIPIARTEEKNTIVIIDAQGTGPVETSDRAEGDAPFVASAIIVFDSDGDGLPDEVEKRLGTDPYDPDTDKDGYSDNEEILNGYNPSGVGKLVNGLKPVERALATKAVFEQPKINTAIQPTENLRVAKVDNTRASSTDKTAEKNKLRFSGVARPNDVVTLFIYSSMPIVITVSTDSNGNWVYELDKTLVDGKHEAYVVINDEHGKIQEKSSPFAFFINEAQAVSNTIELPKADIDVPDQTNSIIAIYTLGGFGLILITLLLFFAYNRYHKAY